MIFPLPFFLRLRDNLIAFKRNVCGSYLIEAAILFPILLGISLAVIEFGFLFMRDMTVKNYLSQMVQRIERGQVDVSPVVAAMQNDSLLANQNIRVCTSTANTCTGTGIITAAVPSGSSIVINVTRDYTPLTPAGNLLNFVLGAPPSSQGGARTISRRESVVVGNVEFNCDPDQVLQSITGGAATCVPRDNNYQCPVAGQILEKIVDGSPVCVARDGDYTCAAGQVLKEVINGAAVCVDRDSSYGCPAGQVLSTVINGTPICVDMDRNYACSGTQVLQATSGGTAVCIERDTGYQTCPSGQFMNGISNGIALCASLPGSGNSWGACYNVTAPLDYRGFHYNDQVSCNSGYYIVSFRLTGNTTVGGVNAAGMSPNEWVPTARAGGGQLVFQQIQREVRYTCCKVP